MNSMIIREENKNIPMGLLLLADPSEKSIRESLQDGNCYVLEELGEVQGAFVIGPAGIPYVAEISSIAVAEQFQSKGLGKLMMQELILIVRELGYREVRVGTGNSSIGQLAFYQKCGFRIVDIDRDYFLKNYEEEIYENGMRCCDMIILSMTL